MQFFYRFWCAPLIYFTVPNRAIAGILCQYRRRLITDKGVNSRHGICSFAWQLSLLFLLLRVNILCPILRLFRCILGIIFNYKILLAVFDNLLEFILERARPIAFIRWFWNLFLQLMFKCLYFAKTLIIRARRIELICFYKVLEFAWYCQLLLFLLPTNEYNNLFDSEFQVILKLMRVGY